MKTFLYELRKELCNGFPYNYRPFGVRPEYVMLTYIVDFYLTKVKIGIEVDGGYHKTQKLYDLERDNKLMDMGCLMLRFTNEEVLYSKEKTKEIIRQTVNNRLQVKHTFNPEYMRKMEEIYS